MKYHGKTINHYEDIRKMVFECAWAEKYNSPEQDDEQDESPIDDLLAFLQKREQGVTLTTKHGHVHGHFVGSIEYAIAGDPINGFETDRMMAFAADNGQIVGAFKEDGRWITYPLKDLGGVLHWDEYPEEWPVEWTRPESIERPVQPKRHRLTDFIDDYHRTDLVEFLYVVKNDDYTIYVGHDRKCAAKHMKTLRRSNSQCLTEVWYTPE